MKNVNFCLAGTMVCGLMLSTSVIRCPAAEGRVSGDRPWVFRPAPQYQLPAAAKAKLKGAHGGFAVDPVTHDLYFGLRGVGIIRLGPKPGDTEIINQWPALRAGNLHNTTLFRYDGDVYLVCPDNELGRVIVLNRTRGELKVLDFPPFAPYTRPGASFNPTDTEFHGSTLYVADGYSPENLILRMNPFRLEWKSTYFGGKGKAHGKFGTAHGITLDPHLDALAISDRPNSRIEDYSYAGNYFASVHLPAGAWPCDVDFYGDYAAVGCLFGPGKSTPAPVYILDRKGKVVSTIKPKEDLGYKNAVHIHNATWWVIPSSQPGKPDRVLLAVTAWDPGDFFILEQVRP